MYLIFHLVRVRILCVKLFLKDELLVRVTDHGMFPVDINETGLFIAYSDTAHENIQTH